MDLDSVADELYGLPPGEFTAARNGLADRARRDGDRELAGEIKSLAKPTTSAWLVNQLSRERRDELEPLVALGDQLREATSHLSGDELRALTRQRHEVVQALVRQARQLGGEHDTKVSDAVATEVQQTLDASLASPDVADAVLAGRLTQAVEYAGFGEPSGLTWAGRSGSRTADQGKAGRGAGKKPGQDKTTGQDRVADLAARRRASAERDLADAEERLRDARADHEDAQQHTERARQHLQEAEQEVERLHAEAEEAQREARSARDDERAARQRALRAEKAVRSAERGRDEAAERLDALVD